VKVTLYFSGLDRRGGITPDVRQLEDGLRARGVDALATRRLGDLWQRRHGSDRIVCVYGCLPSPYSFAAMALAKAFRCRLVWTPVFHPMRLRLWRGSGLHRVMELFDRGAPHLARYVDGVSAATDEEADFFRRMGAPLARVVPLVAGTEGRHLVGDERLAGRRLFGLGSEPVVLVIAAHSPRRKGMVFSAETLVLLRRRLPQATLLLVGGGDPGPLDGRPGVVVTGWCPDDVLQTAYGCADVLFVPSRYEQFSRATIEAWSHELPVVLSDGVALAPLAREQKAGLVVAYGDAAGAADALEQVIGEPSRAALMGLAGSALVRERFVLDQHVERSLALFGAVVGRDRDPASPYSEMPCQ
jgi:glycosyltransferase involved in cell wall biosynthesis